MGRILVAGELNADLVMRGLPSLPVLGRELVGTGFQIAMGGSSAITAARLAALGAPVDFVGQVGDDDLGHFVRRELGTFGVNTHLMPTIAGASTDVTIALTYEQDRALLTYSGLMATFDGHALTRDLLAEYTHLHVGSFFLQTALQCHLPRIFQQAHALGLTTSLDTGWDPYEQWLDNAHLAPTLAETDYFFPNEDEATALSGDHWDQLAARVRGTLIVKRGADGALALPGDQPPIQAETFAVEVVDTTGAGDAFNAGFLYATVIDQAPLPEALRFATACGAQAVTQVGGATNAPTADAISLYPRDVRTQSTP